MHFTLKANPLTREINDDFQTALEQFQAIAEKLKE
jgi:hypothetical protein